MSKSTAKDLKKIYSMNKPSIIKLIRGVNSESSRAAGYLGDVNSYIFDCAEPWIEKGDIDVIKEVIRRDFRIIAWADELDHEIIFSRDLIIFSLQEIYRQQNKSNIRELEYISDQKLDHALIEEAFPEKDLLEKFIEFGINKFSRNFIKSFPWQDYPNLQATCFSKIPLKLRKQNKAFCLSFILGKEEFSNNDLGKIPKEFKSEINFNTLINLVNVSNSKDKKVIWSFINKYDDKINAENNPEFDRLIDFALNYYEDFILPKKKFLEIDSSNKEVFIDIINVLENEVTENSSSEDIQTLLYEVGKKHKFENLKDFFKLVYQVMLGQDQGPRLGSFFKLFGLRETIDYLKKLIDN